jgi:hypothetical protein
MNDKLSDTTPHPDGFRLSFCKGYSNRDVLDIAGFNGLVAIGAGDCGEAKFQAAQVFAG